MDNGLKIKWNDWSERCWGMYVETEMWDKKSLKKVIWLLFQKVSTSFYTIRHLYIKSEEEGELQSPAFPVPSLRGL